MLDNKGRRQPCRVCGLVKRDDALSFMGYNADGSRRYIGTCRDCTNAQKRARYAADRAALSKAYKPRPNN